MNKEELIKFIEALNIDETDKFKIEYYDNGGSGVINKITYESMG